MRKCAQPKSTIIVIFGAAGDLTRRKLIPAVYNLFVSKHVNQKVEIIGVDRQQWTDDQFRDHLRENLDRFSRRGQADDAAWREFGSRISYLAGDFSQKEIYGALHDRLHERAAAWGEEAQFIFYLARRRRSSRPSPITWATSSWASSAPARRSSSKSPSAATWNRPAGSMRRLARSSTSRRSTASTTI